MKFLFLICGYVAITSALDRNFTKGGIYPYSIIYRYIRKEPKSPTLPYAGELDYTGDAVFKLHSKPLSAKKIYIDVDGHYITGNAWNYRSNEAHLWTDGFHGRTNLSDFTVTEKKELHKIWFLVKDDFDPFDIDVTFESEDLYDNFLIRQATSDVRYGQRALITTNVSSFFCTCGGIAYVNTFNLIGSEYGIVLIFENLLGNDWQNIGEAISHEIGHTLGLQHKSNSRETYQGTIGNEALGDILWGPIMGASRGGSKTHWSNGGYFDSVTENNGNSNEIVAMTRYISAERDDWTDHMNESAAILPQYAIVKGLIGINSDIDCFRMLATQGFIDVVHTPYWSKDNLYIGLELYNEEKKLVKSFSKESGALGKTRIYHEVTSKNLSTFYLCVKGIGMGNPMNNPPNGWNSYGSIGFYDLMIKYNKNVVTNDLYDTTSMLTSVQVSTQTTSPMIFTVKMQISLTFTNSSLFSAGDLEVIKQSFAEASGISDLTRIEVQVDVSRRQMVLVLTQKVTIFVLFSSVQESEALQTLLWTNTTTLKNILSKHNFNNVNLTTIIIVPLQNQSSTPVIETNSSTEYRMSEFIIMAIVLACLVVLIVCVLVWKNVSARKTPKILQAEMQQLLHTPSEWINKS